ncbi:PREDICTED: probable serine/threonine-protein kinase At1g54610 isoform X2 [Ipomoea nil]|uniref:probable serine/threonine-protein kinase At1g54610 isoform X2 n=1 Tax=Ipomoea nil TaxID=35883 RepID=UPI0009011EA3|nr:PREDICTED: probable serine/threonine-protein kinase At1g54610 isoform X2 [Ipomoea nil]
MGCVSSKQARRDAISSPNASAAVSARKGGQRRAQVGPSHSTVGLGGLEKIREESEEGEDEHSSPSRKISENPKAVKKGHNPAKKAAFSIKFGRLTESEHLAAGWPGWLSAVAGEAVEGWLPLRSDKFQRLEKIGQGTYSSVYKARDLDNGKMVALKKVRFDNFQPESVRFMAREITVLRRLDHPNIMKLEGIITSRSSCSIYLVFEYMEHDLSGLLSCSEIKFSDSQIKCFMKQLLSGLEHCHVKGIMHRDIKVSNILVNNEGILKIGDFGLANFVSARSKQPMTSRVVTLWYRPPELLLGATKYGETVDLWSAGCVFAELFFGRPILKGRTEVEQLHKIFKLCGSPSDDYWEQSKLPLAAIFKPQYAYESTLRERCKELPKSAVHLIETLLSIEPYKRGTASSSLNSEYFHTKPYACDPSSMPKFPPNREIDAKFREEARRRKAGSAVRGSGSSRNMRRLRKGMAPTEEVEANMLGSRRGNGSGSRGATVARMSLKSSYDTVSEAASQTATEVSQGDSICSVPAQMISSSSYGWPKKHERAAARFHAFANSRSITMNGGVEPPTLQQSKDDPLGLDEQDGGLAIRPKSMKQVEQPLSFHSPDIYHFSKELSVEEQPPPFLSPDLYHSREQSDSDGRAFSGPLTYRGHKRQDGQAAQSVRRSRFCRDV